MNCEVCGSEVTVEGNVTKSYLPTYKVREKELDDCLNTLLKIGEVPENKGLTTIGKIAKLVEASHHSGRLKDYLKQNYYLSI